MQLELKRATQKTLSAEDQAHKIDQLLAEEENSIARLLKELSQLKEKQFACAQELFEFKRKDGSMEAELHGGKATLRNLGSKQHKLDEELLKQQEILYTQDFQLQQLRHRLSRMEGERTGEEMEILTEKIKVRRGSCYPCDGEIITSSIAPPKRVCIELQRTHVRPEVGYDVTVCSGAGGGVGAPARGGAAGAQSAKESAGRPATHQQGHCQSSQEETNPGRKDR